jgi:hypothetical protein
MKQQALRKLAVRFDPESRRERTIPILRRTASKTGRMQELLEPSECNARVLVLAVLAIVPSFPGI